MKRLCVALLIISTLSEVFTLRPRGFRPPVSVQKLEQYQTQAQAPYKEFYYTQTLDHFNFFTQPQTYQQRYLVSTTYFDPTNYPNAPVLFYTGNEGDISWFYNNTVFMTDVLAKEFNSLVVFAEHRYYGNSLPFGSASFTLPNVAYLTSEQALADYAQLIPVVLSRYGVQGNPVVAIGGSYGGMLAAWFRIKYPNVVAAALAASAPVLQFEGTGVTEEIYNEIITNDYAEADPQCPDSIREAFTAAQNASLAELTAKFQLCEPLNSTSDFINWIENGIGYMAMADYPYPASFLEPMPAWPVNLACKKMAGSGDILARLYSFISVYYNSTGTAQCFNTSVFIASLNTAGDEAWDYQSCTEMIFPISSNGKTDMFPPSPFSLDQLTQYCQQTWGVTPRPQWITTYYGGLNITAASNIIFSNGILDPWSGGGVTRSLSPTLLAIVINEAAHHLDLRGPNPLDPTSVIQARQVEIATLREWLHLF